MPKNDPHANDDNRFYMPIDLLHHVEDLIVNKAMNPSRMVIIAAGDDGDIDVYHSNLNSLETLGLMSVAKQSIIDSSIVFYDDDDSDDED